MQERIEFVDENDQPIGAGTREEAWANGYYQRLVLILLVDENGRILLQKRSDLKKVYPGAWTTSASGHVDEGETYEAAAIHELAEEVGVNTELKFITKFRSEERMGDKDIRIFNAAFVGAIRSDSEIKIEDGEATSLSWFEVDEIEKKIASEPDKFTLSLKEMLRIYRE